MILGKTINAATGETVKVTNLWAADIQRRSTTVSTSAWSAVSGTLSGAALSGSTASVFITPSANTILKNTVVLANGETLIKERRIEVPDSCARDYT